MLDAREFDQLPNALASHNQAHLRHLVHKLLPEIHDADWPDLYYLYLACEAIQATQGCARVLRQVPPQGDRQLESLSLQHAGFMELLRAKSPAIAQDRRKAMSILSFVKSLAELIGDRRLWTLVQGEMSRFALPVDSYQRFGTR